MTYTGKLECIWVTILSCYGSISVSLMLKERDGGLSTLCPNCGFDYKDKVLKTFPELDYVRCKDGVV